MNLKLINNQYKFSLYNNLYSVKAPDGEMDVNELIEVIKYGYLSKEIIQLRKCQGEEYKNAKMQLPAITTSGIFSNRNSENIVNHSGLMQIDIDHVEEYESLFKAICKNTYTYICFRSPGGKGIKVIVKINPSTKTHLEQFYALEKYFRKEFNVEIDTLCKDVSRCMLLSYDPELYCNPFSDVFEELYTPPEKLKPNLESNKTAIVKHSKNDNELIESLIVELKSNKIDLTSSYENWVKVGFALCSAFGENGRGYYHSISENYPNYKFQETDKQYTSLLKKNNGKTTIGTLLFLAKENGINIKTDKKNKLNQK
jgi:hypothetical protein